MATESEGGPEAVIPCEVCNASVPVSQYVQHAQAHATLVIPEQYKPLTQKQGNENWLNNEGATGYLKHELNIKQRLQQRQHKSTATYGYAHGNSDKTVPESILQIIIGYYDTFYIDVLEQGCIFNVLEQAMGHPKNTGQSSKLRVVFSENEPIGIESSPFRHYIEWSNVKFVCDGCLTPVFKEALETNSVEKTDKSCFSIVGTDYIFDCFAKDGLSVITFVEALRFFLRQSASESTELGQLYLKENLYYSIPKYDPRQKALMLLQQDLFVMTMTTTFRNLEEERIWGIDQEVRDVFNAQSMYAMALREDVPWRQWGKWAREKVIAYLQNNNKYSGNISHYPTPAAQQTYDMRLDHHYPAPVTESQPVQDNEECLVM